MYNFFEHTLHHLKVGGKHVPENSEDGLGGLRWEMENNVLKPNTKLMRNTCVCSTQTARCVGVE